MIKFLKIVQPVCAFSIWTSSLSLVAGSSALGLNANVNLLAPTAECQALVKVLTEEQSDMTKGLQTDQVMIAKDNTTVFAWVDGSYTLSAPHSMWSGSKSITATIVGAAIQKGDLSLTRSLSDFFPQKFSDPVQQNRYNAITIENLLNMSAGFVWDEEYESDPVSSVFLRMLYLEGRQNMAAFARAQPLEIEPGKKWNYSGGNSSILMSILRKIYGNTDFPNKLVFDKLGLKSAFYEKDGTGTPVGSTYAYLNPEEMTKIGQFYLQNGNWNGEQILPLNWMAAAKTVAAPLTRIDNASDLDYVRAEGVYSNRGFWLNQDIPTVHRKDQPEDFMHHEFVHSPPDLFFTAGHYGQMILMLPSQNIVIAITGHNSEYWSKIDRLVSSTLACLAPGTVIPPPQGLNPAPAPDAPLGLSKTLSLGSQVLSKEVLQSIVAKEICSCQFVSGLSESACVSRANLPLSESTLSLLASMEERTSPDALRVGPTLGGWLLSLFRAGADQAEYFGPHEGCRLVEDRDRTLFPLPTRNEDGG